MSEQINQTPEEITNVQKFLRLACVATVILVLIMLALLANGHDLQKKSDAAIADLTAQVAALEDEKAVLTAQLAATEQAWQEARAEANEASERIAAADELLNGILSSLQGQAPAVYTPATETPAE